jgi:hypothetical protein
MMGVIRRQGGTRQDVGGRSARARRPGPQRRQPSRSGRAGGHGVAPGDQMTGIDRSAVGRMWSSADLFASDERRGRACLGRAWPDFDSAALFAWGDTGACVSFRTVGVGVTAVLVVPADRDDDDLLVTLERRGPPC